MSDKKHWITKLVPALAFAAGIIIASVGGIMTISSSLKLAIFESEPYTIITKEQCRYDYNRQDSDLAPPASFESENRVSLDQPYQRNDREIEKCITERKQGEKIRFQKNQQENIVDGVSALIVGGILLLAFRRRK